jgi:hypothetical protein
MIIVRAPSTRTKSNRPGRPFGEGILPEPAAHPAGPSSPPAPGPIPSDIAPHLPRLRLFVPSPADRAWALGFDLGRDGAGPVEASSRYTPAERDAFLLGLAVGSAAAHADESDRLDAIRDEAAEQDHCELAEARMATPGEHHD